jgi:hypothetical protein
MECYWDGNFATGTQKTAATEPQKATKRFEQ